MSKRMLAYAAVTAVTAFLALAASGARVSTATATIHGVVTDPSGAAIPGASVTVSGGHESEAVSTNESGQYTLDGLDPGHYRVQVRAAGFTPFERSGLLLSSGYETEADAQLSVRALKQKITVTANQ